MLWGFPAGSDGKESASSVGDLGSVPGLERSPGEGNGNPLQYSCLENFTNREAWWATVQTQPSDFHFHFSLWIGRLLSFPLNLLSNMSCCFITILKWDIFNLVMPSYNTHYLLLLNKRVLLSLIFLGYSGEGKHSRRCKGSLTMSMLLPKVGTLSSRVIFRGWLIFPKKSNAPYHYNARSQGRIQRIWPESELSDEKRWSKP